MKSHHNAMYVFLFLFLFLGRSSSFEGTPEYMSPELLIDKECDTR